MIRLYMSMSLDGFITGPDDRPGQELGRGGGRLFNWLDDRHGTGVNAQIYAEALATGAVIAGRRTFDLAGQWNGDHHDGVPIHILTHQTDLPSPPGTARYYNDVTTCATEARAAAGDRDILVHGAGTAQSLLAAGQLDEIEVHLVPVLLGSGRRLFDDQYVELEPLRQLKGQDATHLRYRVLK
ncbi:dihydrofolate reductase family protein [Kribbella sp. NPDC051770]|uniref:dihydrofolate reductase family protein n=1 Tax=Kribbella sp. NPDC051770 TaxID=3155413 RepID=UPI00343793EC